MFFLVIVLWLILRFQDAFANLRGSSTVDNKIPLYMKNNLATLEDVSLEKDTPLFWHVPKAGGSTLKDLTAGCLKLVVASQVGARNGHNNDTSLSVVNVGEARYVNIDSTSFAGIEHAKELEFAGSNLSDIVVSPLLTDATKNLFTRDSQGVLFTMLRHPVDREVSLFYYLQHADWEKTYSPEFANMTIEEYTLSEKFEADWMVRFLVGKLGQRLVASDMEVAKTILREKCLVGLMSEMETSLKRFGKFFGWDRRDEWNTCFERFSGHGSNSHKHPAVLQGSKDWEILARRNQMDIELYEFAVGLFQQQGVRYFATEGSNGER